jgi:hypothetical protein
MRIAQRVLQMEGPFLITFQGCRTLRPWRELVRRTSRDRARGFTVVARRAGAGNPLLSEVGPDRNHQHALWLTGHGGLGGVTIGPEITEITVR